MIWNLEQYGDSCAIKDEYGNQVTYSQLKTSSDAIANATGERCLIFCLCRNEIGAIAGYVGFLNNDIVPVILNSHLDHDLLARLIETYKPSYIWLPKDQASGFDEMTVCYEAFEYALLDTKNNKSFPLYKELALLLTTSGSTGSPKFVRQSYANIKSNTASIVKYLMLDASERAITTLPMYYTYGLSIINSHLKVGATILATEKGIMQKEFWQFFRDQEATSFGGVPYTYEMLARLRFFRMDLPSLRTMTQAGGKLLPELHEIFAEYARDSEKKFIVMYGQCEATARMGYLPPEKAIEKKGSMGIAIPGGAFTLIDENGDVILSPNQNGELIYRGENVTLGYAECGEDLIRGDERNGVLETGDIAQFDEEGYYYIVGRKKRFLKIYGNRVNLDEIDGLIKTKFHIEVATTGVDDHMIIYTTGRQEPGDIISYLTSKTGLNSKAFEVVVLDEIPKNESGKTLYKELPRVHAE